MSYLCQMYSRVVLILILSLFGFMSHGQQIATVIADEAELDGVRRKGLSVMVELDKKFVDKAYVKLLKEAGRAEVSRTGSITVKPAVLPGIPGTMNATAFGRTDQGQKGTRVFLAVDFGTEMLDATNKAWGEVKKYLYDFAVQLYRDDLNNQIAEADKAVDAAVRQNEDAQEQANTIKKQMERNANEKQRLVRQLKENEAELYKLKSDSVQNKIVQATTLDEISRLRKLVEDKKAKFATLN